MERKLEEFTRPTSTAPHEKKPTINQFYSDSFNAVDRFNRFMSHLPLPLRSETPKMCWFLNMIRFCVVTSYLLYTDFKSESVVDEDAGSLRDLAMDLAKALIA